ncbi:glycosyltransferase family 4 protein [Arthrobacter sp. MYb222]|uniref:glycosyltransferase family 4 protein n=1 Tax=Arthrobacter sp. MYb222 TaxID=1848599 RepID=UPI000CFBE7BA|nr:glycosyltransferase family 4 protein [Arthrobacter sp. MYb222]PQZ83531.1 hypothetical protein CQ016_16800 [Arthrobacter sp. MYb222]
MAENRSFVDRVIRKMNSTPSNRGRATGMERARSMELQSQARECINAGDHVKARSLYRHSIVCDPTNSGAYLNYINFLISKNESTNALEITQLLLAADPSSPDGFELFIELTNVVDKTQQGVVTLALANFSRAIVEKPMRFRDALDFLIPYRQEKPLEQIATFADDEVSRMVAQSQLELKRGASQAEVISRIRESQDPDLIEAILWLARGKASSAIEALNRLDKENVPLKSLRRAIRRAKNADRMKIAAKYAIFYATVDPKDKWIAGIAKTFDTRNPSNYLLGKKGYKFPKNSNEQKYAVADKKVFYLLHNSLPYHSAGYATRTHGLLSELNRTDWTVDGVTRLGYPYDMPGMAELGGIPSSNMIDGVSYRRLLKGQEIEKKNPLFNYVQRYSSVLQKSAVEHKPAIIHAASNHWNGLAAVTAARKLGIPSIYEVRGLWEVTRGSRNPEWAQGNMFKFMARMEADAARGATRVFTITRALKDEMVARGVDENKIQIIPNGVDTKRFQPREKDSELASKLGLHNKTVIGYVGSILDYEGIELMLEAAAILKRERDDFHVLIVGDGAELEKFKSFSSEEDLDDVITFTGRVPHEEVESYYSLIDITPFPRLPLPVCEMVSPLKPFEAMAMGKAVIASNVDALSEIVTPGLNGLLHQKGDAQSLTEGIRSLLDDSALRIRLGQQSREWVVRERDWSKLALTVSNAYEELWAQMI